MGINKNIQRLTVVTIVGLTVFGLFGGIPGFIIPKAHALTGTSFDNVVVVAMENQNYADVMGTGTGSSNAPFLATLLPESSTIPSYHSYGAGSNSISGCSAACYVAFISGSTYGVSDAYGCCLTGQTFVDRLAAAGGTWQAYCESGCPRGNDHFPFTAFITTSNSPNIFIGSSVSTSDLIAAANSPTPPNFLWFTPTDNNNMHDNSIQTGDSYLQSFLVGTGTVASPAPGSLLASNLFQPGHRTLLYIWWDEYDPSPNLFYGTGVVKQAYVSTGNLYDEYSSLRLLENNWALPTLTANDAAASPMTEVLAPSGPIPLSASFTVSASPTVNLPVTFTATSAGGTPPYVFTWTFGDGGTGSGSPVSHTFTTAAAFTVTLTSKDSSSPQQTVTASLAVTVVAIPGYSNCGIPVVTTTDLVVGGGTLASGGFTPGVPDKRSTAPPCSVNGSSMYIRILNVTLTNITNGAASQDCNPINGVTYCDSTADAVSFGSTQTLHIEIDQAWKAAGIAPPDFPTDGSRIDITGFAYWDVEHGCCWELHPVTAWNVVTAPPPPPPPTSSNFGVCTPLPQGWSCGNTNGLSGSSVNIVSGVLQTRESNPGVGSDSAYYFATTQKGTFPWSPCQAPASGVLPSSLASVSTTFTPLTITPSGSYRYHIYVALYYWLPNGAVTAGGSTYRCLDTQVRVENVGGTFSPAGSTATYNPGDSFGWDQVTIGSVSVGGTYTLTANVQQQCQQDEAAWGIPTSTPCQLAGIEVGTEGYQFQQLDVDWYTVSLNTNSPSPDLTASINFTPSSPVAGQGVSFTGSATGGIAPYTFSWTFGDGATATGGSATHSYSTSGSYTVVLTVTDSAGLTASASNTIIVSQSVSPDFTIAVNPSSLTVQAGNSASSTIQLVSLNGFAGTVSISVNVSLTGPTVGLSPQSLSMMSGGSTSTILTVSTVSSTPAGSYDVSVNAGSGSRSHGVHIPVTVEAAQAPPPTTRPPQGQGTCAWCQITHVASTNTWLFVAGTLAGFMATLTVVYLRARNRLAEARRMRRISRNN